MIESVTTFPTSDDLVDLAPGSQIDMRPTLLRVFDEYLICSVRRTPLRMNVIIPS